MHGRGGRPVPNLFIIGAMKSGTTSLHYYLAAHPQVFMCEPKEPGYFVEELNLGQGPDWYLGLFRDARDARIIGESSTHYTKLPTYQGVPGRIRDFSPEARFVYLMRDPIERMVSHYWHNVRNLFLEAERRAFAEAVAEDPQYFAFGDYALQLQPYFQLFGRNRVYCLTYEEMVADPAATTEALLRWLGLEGALPAAVFTERLNARPPIIRRVRGWGLLNRVAHSAVWSRISPIVPKSLKQVAGAVATRQVNPEAEIDEADLEPLRPRVRMQVEALRVMLGRDFPMWKSLYSEPDAGKLQRRA